MKMKQVDLGHIAEPKEVKDCLSFSEWLGDREPNPQTIDFYQYYLIRSGVPKAKAQAEGAAIIRDMQAGRSFNFSEGSKKGFNA